MIFIACLLGGMVLAISAFLLQLPTYLAITVFAVVSAMTTIAIASLANK